MQIGLHKQHKHRDATADIQQLLVQSASPMTSDLLSMSHHPLHNNNNAAIVTAWWKLMQ